MAPVKSLATAVLLLALSAFANAAVHPIEPKPISLGTATHHRSHFPTASAGHHHPCHGLHGPQTDGTAQASGARCHPNGTWTGPTGTGHHNHPHSSGSGVNGFSLPKISLSTNIAATATPPSITARAFYA